MATNADQDDTSTVVDDDKEVTEEDLRDLKYGSTDVETSEEEDETEVTEENEEESEETGEADGQTEDQAEAEESDEEPEAPQFVKEFPYIKGDTPEEYAKNLELAYKNSTSEALKWKGLAEGKTDSNTDKQEEPVDLDPNALYIKQLRDNEITTAFSEITKHYPQVNDQTEYNKFVSTVGVLSNTILQSEKRLASPKELYSKAAVILGWEPEGKVDDKDKLGNALKDRAAVSKTSSATTKKISKSKVTDAIIAANRLMYPEKTDAEIREELEPWVQ